MAQYLLSVLADTTDLATAEEAAAIDVFNEQLQANGHWVFAGGLHGPGASTVLRAQDGDVLATDGPYAEGKEHVGGFTIVDVPDLDAALDWGGRLARAIGLPIEVRPFRYSGG